MRQIDQPVYQGAKNLWGKLFEYCSDYAPVFSRYERRYTHTNEVILEQDDPNVYCINPADISNYNGK